MPNTRPEVTWANIEKQCGGYRDGFVNVFREHQGKKTDEKDAQGRTVKVTIASFARHAGIPEQTFRQWVRATKQVVQPEDRERLDKTKETRDDRAANLRTWAEHLGWELYENDGGGIAIVDPQTGEPRDGCENLSLLGVAAMLDKIGAAPEPEPEPEPEHDDED